MDPDQALSELTPRLLRYCTARTGDKSLGEDIAQDALVAPYNDGVVTVLPRASRRLSFPLHEGEQPGRPCVVDCSFP